MFYQITLRDPDGFAHPGVNAIVETVDTLNETSTTAIQTFLEDQEPEDLEALRQFEREGYTLKAEPRVFSARGVMGVTT